jgi:hypothetical protein
LTHFNAIIQQFGEQGDKTGWHYIVIPAAIAQQLKPGNKKTFRVKGKLDAFAIEGVSLLPMGEGDFIMPINATMRKGTKKRKGATLHIQLQIDTKELKPPAELMECLEDEPKALAHFKTLARSHQNYFGKWVSDAKTEETKAKRIAQAVNALAKGFQFGEMIRAIKKERDELMK